MPSDWMSKEENLTDNDVLTTKSVWTRSVKQHLPAGLTDFSEPSRACRV